MAFVTAGREIEKLPPLTTVGGATVGTLEMGIAGAEGAGAGVKLKEKP